MNFLNFFIVLYAYFSCSPVYASLIWDQRDCATPALAEVLKIKNPGISDINKCNLAEIVKATQGDKTGWLRGKAQERWDLPAGDDENLRQALIRIGLQNEIAPQKSEYTHAVVLGCNYFTFQTRLSYLRKLWDRGIRWKTLVFLSSARPLNEKEMEPLQDVLSDKKVPLTEFGAMRYGFAESDIPDDVKRMAQIWVNTQAPSGKDRANTDDTIDAWIKNDPKVCQTTGPADSLKSGSDLLVISSAPYVLRQGLVVKTKLRSQGIASETVGDRDEEGGVSPERVPIYLDEIARTLYQLNSYDSLA